MNYTEATPVCAEKIERDMTLKETLGEIDTNVTCCLTQTVRLANDLFWFDIATDPVNATNMYEAVQQLQEKSERCLKILTQLNERVGV